MSDTIRINKVIRERIDTYKSEQLKHYQEWSKEDPRWQQGFEMTKKMTDSDIIAQVLWMAILKEREFD